MKPTGGTPSDDYRLLAERIVREVELDMARKIERLGVPQDQKTELYRGLARWSADFKKRIIPRCTDP